MCPLGRAGSSPALGTSTRVERPRLPRLFSFYSLRSGPVVGPLLQRLQEIRVVSWRPKRVHSLFRLCSQPELFQDVANHVEARLLKALVGWMFPHHCIPLPAHSGVSNALQSQRCSGAAPASCLRARLPYQAARPSPTVIDARSGAVVHDLLAVLIACRHSPRVTNLSNHNTRQKRLTRCDTGDVPRLQSLFGGGLPQSDLVRTMKRFLACLALCASLSASAQARQSAPVLSVSKTLTQMVFDLQAQLNAQDATIDSLQNAAMTRDSVCDIAVGVAWRGELARCRPL